MNTRNLLLPNQAQDYLKTSIQNYCTHKTPVLIVMFEKQSQPCGILYKMLKQNNLINCIIVPCKNNLDDLKRFEKVIRRNFEDAFIFVIRSCDCSLSTFGNVSINASPLYFVTHNTQFEPVGDACISVHNNLILKAPFQINNLQKIQSLSIISGLYNIICKAFDGN